MTAAIGWIVTGWTHFVVFWIVALPLMTAARSIDERRGGRALGLAALLAAVAVSVWMNGWVFPEPLPGPTGFDP